MRKLAYTDNIILMGITNGDRAAETGPLQPDHSLCGEDNVALFLKCAQRVYERWSG